MEKPMLRTNIQIIPSTTPEGDKGFIIMDTNLQDHTLFLSAGATLILQLLNGQNTINDIQYTIMKETAQLIDSVVLENFVGLLNEHYFLKNDRYNEIISEQYRIYKSEQERPSLMAGRDFPAEQGELREYLDGLFADSKDHKTEKHLPDDINGIVMPHIDIARGKNVYTAVFKSVRNYPPADLYVVLGVNHQFYSTNPFIMTDRDYKTPLGICPTDKDILDTLITKLDEPFRDELAHKGEHSIEFPALFLKYIYPESHLNFLPVLVNFNDKNESRVVRFIDTLKSIIRESSKTIVIVSSVDFSHIGPQFGWQREVKEEDIDSLSQRDFCTIRLLEEGNADEFYDDIMKDNNERNIDAYGASYIMSKLLDGKPGNLILYDQAFSPMNTVTFCGMIF